MEYVRESGWRRSGEHSARVFLGLLSRIKLPSAVEKRENSYDREHNENVHYWNFGCASQRNLAAMVENPADLVQPRGETPPYTGRRTTVLDKYHRGESSATVYPDKDQGKISDVGK